MMRQFQRADEPEVLRENFERWTTQYVQLRRANPGAKFIWYTVNGVTARAHILPALKLQTADHCSFCDAFPIDGVSNETIEHFRPKSQFPEQAYLWANLYYCCDACQSAKREEWDERLLQPDGEGYTFTRYFEFDFTTGQIRPSSLTNEEEQSRAARTIELYGLDTPSRRRNRLLEARKQSANQGTKITDIVWAYRDFLGVP
jgi:uncharacterized protein (TIGR02646 family)